MKMVLQRKLDPVLTNVHVLEHPVIIQRNAANKINIEDKKKVKKIQTELLFRLTINTIQNKNY